MKSSKLIEIFKNGNMVIPLYLLKNYKKNYSFFEWNNNNSIKYMD